MPHVNLTFLRRTSFAADQAMDVVDSFDALEYDALYAEVRVYTAGSGTVRFLHAAVNQRDAYLVIPSASVSLSVAGSTFIEVGPLLRFVRWGVDSPVGNPDLDIVLTARSRRGSSARARRNTASVATGSSVGTTVGKGSGGCGCTDKRVMDTGGDTGFVSAALGTKQDAGSLANVERIASSSSPLKGTARSPTTTRTSTAGSGVTSSGANQGATHEASTNVPSPADGDCCDTGDGFCIRGYALGGLSVVDDLARTFMQGADIPNMSVAIVDSDGRLVLTRGYTNCPASPENKSVFIAYPQSRYRLMSVSKSFTGTALALLEQDGVVDIANDTVGKHLPDWVAKYPDSPIWNANLQQVLSHTSVPGAYFEIKDHSPDESTQQLKDLTQIDEVVAAAVPGAKLPVSIDNILTYAASLDGAMFDPAAAWPACPVSSYEYTYLNFGYMILGKVIEGASGTAYEDFVKKRLFEPLSMSGMELGWSKGRFFDEVDYYYASGEYLRNVYTFAAEDSCDDDAPGTPYRDHSVLDSSIDCAEVPYGALYNIDNFEAFGGWVGNVVDLCRFGWHMSTFANATLFETEEAYDAVTTNWAKKFGCTGGQYGYGWFLDPSGLRSASGGKEGTNAKVLLAPPNRYWIDADGTHVTARTNGITVAIVMNRHALDLEGNTDSYDTFREALVNIGSSASVLDKVTDWGGSKDLWPLYAEGGDAWDDDDDDDRVGVESIGSGSGLSTIVDVNTPELIDVPSRGYVWDDFLIGKSPAPVVRIVR